MNCCCDWPATCGGTRVLFCEGCGGDQCVCRCGGDMDCLGCPDCEGDEDDDFFYDDQAPTGEQP